MEGDVTTLSQAIKSQRRCTCPERLLAKEPAFGMSAWAQHGCKWYQPVLPGIPSLGEDQVHRFISMGCCEAKQLGQRKDW